MELIHFSHEHSLFLNKEVHTNDSCTEVVCYGCNIPISLSEDDNTTAYGCDTCNLFLHKRCAKARREITHPFHQQQHTLTLLSKPSYSTQSCICNICRVSDWKWFTYNCDQCNFDMDIICALKPAPALSSDSECHPHTLTFQSKEALFDCDACGVKSEDFCYLCTKCTFWIHQKCVSFPSVLYRIDHKHALNLQYSLSDRFRKDEFSCVICRDEIDPNKWIYSCLNCRYFIHLKCSTTNATLEPLTESDDQEDPITLMNLPIRGRASDLISKFVKEKRFGDSYCDRGGEKRIDHWNHHHSLIHWDGDVNINIAYDGMLCAACARPITSSFYHCGQCSYFLHTYCAFLPLELQYPGHPDHILKIKCRNEKFDSFVCVCCGFGSNGFFYSCRTCNVHIDVWCISVPTKIIHDSHGYHPLYLCQVSNCECDACYGRFSGIGYKCVRDLCNYNLEFKCATMSSNQQRRLKSRFMDDEFNIDQDEFKAGDNQSLYEYLGSTDSEDEGDQNPDQLMSNLISDKTANLIRIFLEDADRDGGGETEIQHWNHEHPLILWDGETNSQEMNTNFVYDGMSCGGCVQPIAAPFYHCRECSYVLHKNCALLPQELTHPSHPEHPLQLNSGLMDGLFYFVCSCCGSGSSGFFYSCQKCDVNIDIRCITLPTTIQHESHEHPLVAKEVDCLCDACKRWFCGIAYQCELNDCRYTLMFKCATLPLTLFHSYDEHPISLTFPPIKYHPGEFYCEICEEDLDPQPWLYYCRRCRFSFHIKCIYPEDDLYSKVKFGDKHKVHDHEHPLTFIRNGANNYPCPCGICGRDKTGRPVLDCSECGYKICNTCAGKQAQGLKISFHGSTSQSYTADSTTTDAKPPPNN